MIRVVALEDGCDGCPMAEVLERTVYCNDRDEYVVQGRPAGGPAAPIPPDCRLRRGTITLTLGKRV
jgi:hypothetical protein